MRRRVIALDVLSARSVGIPRDAVAHDKFFFGYDAMSYQSGNGVIRAAHVSDMHSVLIVPEFSNVRDLSTRFGVKHRAVQDEFAFRARGQLVYHAFFRDNGFDAG